MNDTSWFFAVLIGLVLLYGGAFTSSNKITDYVRSCDQENISAQSCTSWNLESATYYINENTQQVFFDGTYGPVAFSGCTVANRDNWYCSSTSAYGFGYKNGVVEDNTLTSQTFATQHFGLLSYWWYKGLSWIGVK